MTQVWAALDAAWRILVIGVVLAPACPPCSPSAFAPWHGAPAAKPNSTRKASCRRHRFGRVIGIAIFVFVVLVVLLAISYIVAHGLGYNLSFSGGWPTFVPR